MTRRSLIVLFSIAAFLRSLFIWVPPLWYDENFTLILARLPWDRMIIATAGDVHPPLWYAIEWIMLRLFSNPMTAPAWTIRLPALVYSMLALYTFYLVMKELLLPRKVIVVAMWLMAVLPFQLWYAQEGRMYAMLEFLVLASLYFALTGNWIGLGASAFCMLYTQNYSIFYLAVIAFVILMRDVKSLRWLIGSYAAAGLLYLPWFNVILSQMSDIKGRYWITDFSAGAVLNAIYKQFFASAMPGFATVGAFALVFSLLIFGIIQLLKYRHVNVTVIMLMAFAPVALGWIASLIWQPVLLFRPLIGISPFLYIIVAFDIYYLCIDNYLMMRLLTQSESIVLNFRGRFEKATNLDLRKSLIAAMFVLPVIISGLAGYYMNISAMKGEGAVSSMENALAYVKANWQKGDVIYYTDDGPFVNVWPYAEGMPEYHLPACDERVGYSPVLGSLSDQTRNAIGIQIANLSDVEHTRAWVFAPRSPLHPQCYEDQIAPLTVGQPVLVVDDNEFISSGVWLVVNEK